MSLGEPPSNGDEWRFEARLAGPDGEERDLQLSVSAFRGSPGPARRGRRGHDRPHPRRTGARRARAARLPRRPGGRRRPRGQHADRGALLVRADAAVRDVARRPPLLHPEEDGAPDVPRGPPRQQPARVRTAAPANPPEDGPAGRPGQRRRVRRDRLRRAAARDRHGRGRTAGSRRRRPARPRAGVREPPDQRARRVARGRRRDVPPGALRRERPRDRFGSRGRTDALRGRARIPAVLHDEEVGGHGPRASRSRATSSSVTGARSTSRPAPAAAPRPGSSCPLVPEGSPS